MVFRWRFLYVLLSFFKRYIVLLYNVLLYSVKNVICICLELFFFRYTVYLQYTPLICYIRRKPFSCHFEETPLRLARNLLLDLFISPSPKYLLCGFAKYPETELAGHC
jgi:hypothetical protein